MVIGIDASRANQQHRTGTEWYSFHVIQELKKLIPAEHQVMLYSKQPLLPDLADLPPNWTSRVLAWPPKLLWTQFRLSLEMIISRPDLLYVPAHTIPFIHPKKVLTVIHDAGFDRQKELYGTAERAYHRFSVRLALKDASEIITVSEFSKREMLELYEVASERIKVIPNGFNDLSTIPETDVLQRNQIQSPYFFYMGRLEHKKNTPRLVQAFAELKQRSTEPVQLVLAGSAGFGYNEITQAIQDNQLTNDVKLLGWTSDEDAATLMKHAHAFVFPSLYEGFGIPVLEAMNVGTPVIASNIPALKEVAGDAALFFPSNSSSALANAMETLLTQPQQREQLIQRGKKQVQHYSWKRTAEETWNRMKAILNRS